jgi:hypothetical protein
MNDAPCPPQQKQIVKRAVPLGDWPRPYDQIQVAPPQAPPLYVPPREVNQVAERAVTSDLPKPTRGDLKFVMWVGAGFFVLLAIVVFIPRPSTQPSSPAAAPASNLTAATSGSAPVSYSRLYKMRPYQLKEVVKSSLKRTGWVITDDDRFRIVAKYGLGKEVQFSFSPSRQGGTDFAILMDDQSDAFKEAMGPKILNLFDAIQAADDEMSRFGRN